MNSTIDPTQSGASTFAGIDGVVTVTRRVQCLEARFDEDPLNETAVADPYDESGSDKTPYDQPNDNDASAESGLTSILDSFLAHDTDSIVTEPQKIYSACVCLHITPSTTTFTPTVYETTIVKVRNQGIECIVWPHINVPADPYGD